MVRWKPCFHRSFTQVRVPWAHERGVEWMCSECAVEGCVLTKIKGEAGLEGRRGGPSAGDPLQIAGRRIGEHRRISDPLICYLVKFLVTPSHPETDETDALSCIPSIRPPRMPHPFYFLADSFGFSTPTAASRGIFAGSELAATRSQIPALRERRPRAGPSSTGLSRHHRAMRLEAWEAAPSAGQTGKHITPLWSLR